MVCLLTGVASERVRLFGQPKSGTTWLEVIVKTLAEFSCASGKQEQTGCESFVSKPNRDYSIGSSEVVSVNGKHGLIGGVGLARNPLIDVTGSYEKLGLAKCTVMWSSRCLPMSLFDPRIITGRSILIVRDPRAVVVSGYHYFQQKSETLQDYFLDRVPKVAALTSVRYWWFDERVRETIPTLILFYEDLLDDTVNQYYRIASFLRLRPDFEAMCSVVNKTSATSMKEQEHENQIPGPNNWGQEKAKVRNATSRAFQDEIRALPDGPNVFINGTRSMASFLHPALQARYLYTYDDDIHALKIPKKSILHDFLHLS